MNDKKTNRRVLMTKRMLKEALVRAMLVEHISKVSVTQLCEAADINRSTFYAHYKDQYDLLEQIEQEVIENFQNHLGRQSFNQDKALSNQVLIQVLEYVKENADLFKALLSENCDATFQNEILKMSEILSYQLYSDKGDRLREYLNLFGLRGAVGMLQKWLMDGMIEPIEDMADLIMQVIYHGILSF